MEYMQDRRGNIYGVDIVTPVGQMIHIGLDKPNVYEGKEAYQVTLLFPKNDPDITKGLAKLQGLCKELAGQKWGDPNIKLDLPFVRDGDKKGKNGFAGKWFLKATAAVSDRPLVKDNNKRLIDPAFLQPGMWGRAVVIPFAYQMGTGPKATMGIAYKLRLVQFSHDTGERFKGGIDPDSLIDIIDSGNTNGTGEEKHSSFGGTEDNSLENSFEQSISSEVQEASDAEPEPSYEEATQEEVVLTQEPATLNQVTPAVKAATQKPLPTSKTLVAPAAPKPVSAAAKSAEMPAPSLIQRAQKTLATAPVKAPVPAVAPRAVVRPPVAVAAKVQAPAAAKVQPPAAKTVVAPAAPKPGVKGKAAAINIL